jgi:hypothetical protein
VVVNFDDYIAKLDDGSTFFVKGHDVTMVVDHEKIQVVDLIGKFNEHSTALSQRNKILLVEF